MADKGLIPCPFCGNPDVYTEKPMPAITSQYAVYCRECKATTYFESYDERLVIIAWNKRKRKFHAC